MHVQHTFLVHFFAVVLHDHKVKLPETFLLHVLWRKCRTCCCSLFFTRSFSPWWPLGFLIFSPPLNLFFQQIAPYLPLQLSVALFLVKLHWPVAYFTFSLYSKFVDMTINLSLILQTTRIQKQTPLSVFVFIDSLVASASQDAGGYAISRQNNLELHLGCHTSWLSYFTVVQTDGRSGVRSGDYQNFSEGQITKFSNPWCSASPAWSSAKIITPTLSGLISIFGLVFFVSLGNWKTMKT